MSNVSAIMALSACAMASTKHSPRLPLHPPIDEDATYGYPAKRTGRTAKPEHSHGFDGVVPPLSRQARRAAERQAKR